MTRLVERCLHGNAAALREFLEQFQGRFSVYACDCWAQREDAEEVTQETFLRAFRHLSHWDAPGLSSPWCRRSP